jgi:hypothetical protein
MPADVTLEDLKRRACALANRDCRIMLTWLYSSCTGCRITVISCHGVVLVVALMCHLAHLLLGAAAPARACTQHKSCAHRTPPVFPVPMWVNAMPSSRWRVGYKLGTSSSSSSSSRSSEQQCQLSMAQQSLLSS